MNKQIFNVNKLRWFLLKHYDNRGIKSYTITFLFFLLIIQNLYSQNYYVSASASGSGNGTISNPWTIYQAAANAQAGDTVFIDKGTYPLTSVLSFNNSGTYSKPIVFRGVRANEDEKTADGVNNTLLRQDNSSTSGQISIGGSYVTIENMIIRQSYPKYLLTVSSGANKFTLDSVVVQYPSNVSSSSNHTLVTGADSTTIRYCYFWQGPRTIIWVRNSNGTHCKGFLMEYTTISNYDNHYAIQCMPTTQIGGDPANYRLEDGIIRNCIFRDSGYESAIYLRNVHNYKIYNNIFINPINGSGNQYGMINFLANDGIISAPAYDAASIFAYNTMYQTNDVGNGQIVLHAYTNMSGWTFKNNLVHTTSGATIYAGTTALSLTPAMQNCDVDYNFYYCSSASISAKNILWSDINSLLTINYSWANWKSQRGFDTHTNIDVEPTFVSLSGENFRPLSSISPQVGKGTDLSSWGITTDYDGNPRDPSNPTVGAFEYTNGGTPVDIISPNLVSAVLNNSTSLKLSFSEQLNTSTAQNINNYSINNGITVTAASVSGSQVTLTTSAHSSGNYVVTVNNLTDLAGNVINPNQNTAAYNYTTGDVTPPNLLSATVIDPTTIELAFSEALESASALNKLNYTINNGIVVNSVSLSSDSKKVTLSTTQNAANQTYTVVVSNVKDLAGNLISAANNSAVYEHISTANLVQLPVSRVSASTIPEATHTPAKTIDGKGVNDGDPDSRWAGDTMPEWLVYDLGGIQTINQSRLSFYEWDQGRIYNYSLQTSTDSINWTDVRTNIQSSSQEWTILDIGSVSARYLKIIFNSNNQNNWAGLWEAQLWGAVSTGTDNVSPDLKSATVINSTTIALLFSEPLETTSAQTKTNYSINNGIVVNSAVLSTDKKSVTLSTTQHITNQNYTVTVNNVKDLAGNIISTNNSAQYSFVDNTVGDLKANVKIYLQGPFLSSNMMTELSGNEFLTASQPYNTSPWYYNGSEVLGSGASSSTDWVLVELRSAQNPSQVISRRACLLRNDGRIIEPDGSLGVTFKNLLYGSYYIAVFHRNHLAVMTSVPVSFSPDNVLYDFTNAVSKAYGQNSMIEITAGIFGMYAGDGDGNGTINESDRSNIWSNQNGSMGYLDGDFNRDGGVTVKDINDYWNYNEGKITQVP